MIDFPIDELLDEQAWLERYLHPGGCNVRDVAQWIGVWLAASAC
jgi:hypothetical protein